MPDSAPLASRPGTTPAGSVRLKPRKTRPFYARHPWVLRTAVAKVSRSVQSGDVVDLLNDRGEFVARGIYHATSRIAVRLYTWDPSESLDDAFWLRRLQTAISLRRSLGYLDDPQGACRLVFSEADGLSGLIVDRYGPYLVVQLNAFGMARRIEGLLDLLEDLLQPEGLIVRTDSTMVAAEGLDLAPQTRGALPEANVTIREHGILYSVDLRRGQKTGFYLDQRDNRLAAASLMRDRRVLDLFCYSGSFGLNALVHGGARHVIGVDSSNTALAWARTNAQLNSVDGIEWRHAHVFRVLDELKASGERFGAVILDPPRFSRGRKSLREALRAYHRINRVALELLEDDGILVTCSCSGTVTAEDFVQMLAGAAEKAGRSVQMLERRGASPDHPVRTSCLENEYLKCILARVT